MFPSTAVSENRPALAGGSGGRTITGVPEDENLADLDMERSETFLEEDEQLEYNWRSPQRTHDPNEFYLGEEQEKHSPGGREVFPLTIERGDKQCDTPLQSVSWRDESHPQWVRIRTVMDSGAADSVAPPTLAPQVSIDESPGSKRGQCYVSASAGRMPSMGQ